jgi:hypothetical protein
MMTTMLGFLSSADAAVLIAVNPSAAPIAAPSQLKRRDNVILSSLVGQARAFDRQRLARESVGLPLVRELHKCVKRYLLPKLAKLAGEPFANGLREPRGAHQVQTPLLFKFFALAKIG